LIEYIVAVDMIGSQGKFYKQWRDTVQICRS
jgi:hypothetical protein